MGNAIHATIIIIAEWSWRFAIYLENPSREGGSSHP